MKLNVGCGRFRAPGWVNIDNDPNIIADHVADLTDLPPQITGVTHAYLGHVLHLIHPADVPATLTNLWARCESGAQIAVVCPDALKLIDTPQTLDQLYVALGGEHRQWAVSQQRLVDILRASGLQRCRPVPIDSADLDGFPVVSRVTWQAAVRGQVR